MLKGRKILIDTDIGDDIDDAFALLSAIALDFEIVGITTVFRNTGERARMAKKLLKLFGKDYENIPVYAGCSTPLAETETDYPHLCQYTEDLEDDAYTPDGCNAVDFIAQCCKKYGSDLTIAAIGPFTNIARVIQEHPDALPLAEKVVIMGGAYFRQYVDWNVMCDVEAAQIMFSALPNLECMGADVTHKLLPDKELILAVEQSEAANNGFGYLQELYVLWQNTNEYPPFILHDALVMHYIADRSLCDMEKAHIEVIVQGAARGLTLNTKQYKRTCMNSYYNDLTLKPDAMVAYEVNIDKFTKNIISDIKKVNI